MPNDSTRPLTRRVTFWTGLGALVLFTLVGLVVGGVGGALGMAGLVIAVSALWGILTTRPWWGRTSRRGSSITGGIALVALIVGATISPSTAADDAPAVATSTAVPSSAGTAPAEAAVTATPEPSPTPSAVATPSATASTEPTEAVDDAADAGAGTALAALATLDVKGRAPKTGYDRDEYGPAWSDVDHNGCDTRNDILARDLTDETFKAGTHDCVVLTGTLVDPYGGQTIHFTRGASTSTAVQIDHVVALSDSWQKGAQRWDDATRLEFANDPLNLLASDGPLNMGKSDSDAASWLPPNKSFRCDYVARQVAVKAGYDLWVTQAEHDAMARVLVTCPDEPLPDEKVAAAPVVVTGAKATSTPRATPAPTATPAPAPADVYYQNCDAVRAAGADPIHAGEPGYSSTLDRDGDGVGCE